MVTQRLAIVGNQGHPEAGGTEAKSWISMEAHRGSWGHGGKACLVPLLEVPPKAERGKRRDSPASSSRPSSSLAPHPSWSRSAGESGKGGFQGKARDQQ